MTTATAGEVGESAVSEADENVAAKVVAERRPTKGIMRHPFLPTERFT